MSVQLAGNSNTIVEVDPNSRAMRMTPKPVDYGSLGIYSLGANNGATAMAAGLAAAAPIFSARWGNATNLCVLKKVIISAGDLVAFTAGLVQFNMFAARSFTASDSAGTSVLPSGNQNKLRTSMGTTLFTDLRISATAALTVGTRTLDANPIGSITSSTIATVGTPLLAPYPLFQAQAGDYPEVFAQNEGFVIQATVPASGTWFFSVQMQWEELAAYVP